jgi:hypothetical protein
MKNGFPTRRVTRFLLAEKPAHFPRVQDVLDGTVAMMKYPAGQPETGRSYGVCVIANT